MTNEIEKITPEARPQILVEMKNAIEEGDLEKVSYILRTLHEGNYYFWWGKSFLQHAIFCQNVPIIHLLLLGQGRIIYEVNNEGASAIHTAVQTGNIAVVKAVLSYAGYHNPNLPTLFGRTPLQTATMMNIPEIIELMQEAINKYELYQKESSVNRLTPEILLSQHIRNKGLK